MLIHQHICPRVDAHRGSIFPPAFYAYDSLQAETYGIGVNVSHWTSMVDGLQLGFQWTATQVAALRHYKVYKTYEVIPMGLSGAWMGVQRVGYLLPWGFLPIWVAYRDSITTDRYVMPCNVGYLYNYLLQVNHPVCKGIAPAVQFILDISPTDPHDGRVQSNYLSAQHLAKQAVKEGSVLARDIRSTLHAADRIRDISTAIDVFGNAGTMTPPQIQDWFCQHLLTYPPVKDWMLEAYPYGPIPLPVLHRLTGPSLFDSSPIPALRYPPSVEKLPDLLVETILSIQATDLILTFAIYGSQLHPTPINCFVQNRFGAYLPTLPDGDIKTVFSLLHKLWLSGLYSYGAAEPTPATEASFELTANEEVKISFGDKDSPDRYRVYYANLASVLEMGCSVAQTPRFTQKH